MTYEQPEDQQPQEDQPVEQAEQTYDPNNPAGQRGPTQQSGTSTETPSDQRHLNPEGLDTMSHSERQGERQGQIRPEKSASRMTMDPRDPRNEQQAEETQPEQ